MANNSTNLHNNKKEAPHIIEQTNKKDHKYGQQFHQYKQKKQQPSLISYHWIPKKTMTYGVRIPGLGMG